MLAAADYSGTVLSQGPVGYWPLNETVQPPASKPAANAGSLGTTGNGQYLFGPRSGLLFTPTLGEPGALTGTANTSALF